MQGRRPRRAAAEEHDKEDSAYDQVVDEELKIVLQKLQQVCAFWTALRPCRCLVGIRSTGSIFAWYHADKLASIGILYVILALIGPIHKQQRPPRDSQAPPAPLRRIHPPSQSTSQSLSIDAYLSQLARYLDKHRLGSAGRCPPNVRARIAARDANRGRLA
ncbi:hypothetical protein FKP32DRAFT_1289202 [Trametes sanguinea]|nr:hypothetical protein FKP32DRAFT_1289202 [Trametes sanguinea]